MFETLTPIALFQEQAEILRGCLAGALDGRADSIHDARIATRRIREVLPLTHGWQRRRVVDELYRRFKKGGASLGRVRDADVRVALLRHLESRIPLAAPSLVVLRQREERRRLRRMRKLVKRFERLDVEHELAWLASQSVWQRGRFWVAATGGWRSELRYLLAERARGSREAITHATGVYFPNRMHRARIALKKFRYAAEIASQTGVAIDPLLIRELKRGQEILGELHDYQALLDDLPSDGKDDGDAELGQLQPIVEVAEAEIRDLHERFLAKRSQLCEAASTISRIARGSRLPSAAMTVAAAVALGSSVHALRRKTAGASKEPAREPESAVSVRIPVAWPAQPGR